MNRWSLSKVALCMYCLCLMVLTASTSAASENRLDNETTALFKKLRDDPFNVLSQISDQFAEPLSNTKKAELHLIASRAYSALTLHKKSLSEAEAGLKLVSERFSPLMYHFLSLSKVEAQDGLGFAERGLREAKDALAWADAHGAYSLKAYALSVNGYILITLQEYDNALAHFQTGYKMPQVAQAPYQKEDFAAMMALVYEYRHEPEQAIIFYEEAEQYYREQSMRLELANTLFGLGKSYIRLEDFDKGLPLLLESAKIALDIQDLQGAAFSYEALASLLIKEGKTQQAADFLIDALELFKQGANPYMQINVLIELAKVHLLEDSPQAALSRLNEAEILADGDSFLPYKIAVADTRGEVMAAIGDYKSAYELTLQVKEDRAKLQKEINSQRLLELQTRFEVEQQTAQNALLREQNLRQQTQLKNEKAVQRYTYLVIFLLMVVIGLLAWSYVNGKQHRTRLEKLANHDLLTKLLSRRKTMEDLAQQHSLARRHKDQIAVAIMDLDDFKNVNDQFGHQTGDEVLELFGEMARYSFRKTDILGRIGGEEFLFVFPHTSVEDAKEMLERFAEKVKTIPLAIEHENLKVSVSIGLIDAARCDTTEVIVARADKALYQAKNEGRDCLVQASAPE